MSYPTAGAGKGCVCVVGGGKQRPETAGEGRKRRLESSLEVAGSEAAGQGAQGVHRW